MTVIPVSDRTTQPTPFEVADVLLHMASETCGRGALKDAIHLVARARNVLETEEAFRDARAGRT